MPFNLRFLHFFLFLLLSTLWMCKQKSAVSSPESDTPPIYASEEFSRFYQQFSNDSVFQMEHIVFPLEGQRRQIDSLDIQDPDFRWQSHDWIIHKPYNDLNGTFSREIIDIGGIVIERITDESGTYSMERRFGRLSSGWHLIYYKELGMY